MFVAAIPLLLLGPSTGTIVIAVLGFAMFRLAQGIGGMGTALAAGFAVTCVIVLVAVPNALYILLSFLPSA